MITIDTDYDVIVAGGGIAGTLVATSIAIHSQQNLRVVVVDMNPKEVSGRKTANGWICGDATSKNSIDFLEKHLEIKYSKPELEHPVKGVLVYSPDHETRVLFEGEGYVLNRKILPQRQIRDAEKVGVEFQFNVLLDHLLSENGCIIGVEGKNIVIHCMGGKGRSGTIAAILLIEFGEDNKKAIEIVREKRKGAIETEEQEKFILNYNRIK